jgi:hypothetical protein
MRCFGERWLIDYGRGFARIRLRRIIMKLINGDKELSIHFLRNNTMPDTGLIKMIDEDNEYNIIIEYIGNEEEELQDLYVRFESYGVEQVFAVMAEERDEWIEVD